MKHEDKPQTQAEELPVDELQQSWSNPLPSSHFKPDGIPEVPEEDPFADEEGDDEEKSDEDEQKAPAKKSRARKSKGKRA